MLYYVMCEQKFFTYNYFHSIFPAVFASRTNLFLFTTCRSRQTYTHRWRPELKTSDLSCIKNSESTVEVCQNLLKYSWQPT